MQLNAQQITIVGGGNLGTAIAEGLLRAEALPASQITVTRRRPEKIAALGERGVRLITDNQKGVSSASVVMLAVKPVQLDSILAEIAPALQPGTVVVSVVTGVSVSDLTAALPPTVSIFRAMPNTAIAIGESMTCLATRTGSVAEQALVTDLFKTVGLAIVIDEDLMAAATVLGACGVAYAMRYIRAASQGGIEIGFGADTAQLVAAQTVKGAAALLLTNGQHPEREIDKVTTPQGCTIAGLNEMEHRGFSSALIRGVVASFRKIARMAEAYQQK